MIVSDLSMGELVDRLSTSGLSFRTGQYVSRVRSRLPQIAEGIQSLYGDFAVSDSEFVDFDVSLVAQRGIRRWLLPRAYFMLRGHPHLVLGRFLPQMAPIFLEWGLNYAIYGQVNSSLVLHAAVLERGGRAVVILGDSGAGKSTLCAGLALSGWRLLTDELGLVRLDNGLIDPIVRPVSLKNESINVIRRFSPVARFGPICKTDRKGTVCYMRPLTESVRQMDLPADPAWLIFVRYKSGESLAVEALPKAQAFPDLVRSAFNYPSLGATGFQVLCRMMDRVECRRLTYGKLSDAIAYFDSSDFQSERISR